MMTMLVLRSHCLHSTQSHIIYTFYTDATVPHTRTGMHLPIHQKTLSMLFTDIGKSYCSQTAFVHRTPSTPLQPTHHTGLYMHDTHTEFSNKTP